MRNTKTRNPKRQQPRQAQTPAQTRAEAIARDAAIVRAAGRLLQHMEESRHGRR